MYLTSDGLNVGAALNKSHSPKNWSSSAMEAGLRTFFAMELLFEDARPPIRPDFHVKRRRDNSKLSGEKKTLMSTLSSSSGNEMTFRTVDVLLTLLEKIIDKFHHSNSVICRCKLV